MEKLTLLKLNLDQHTQDTLSPMNHIFQHIIWNARYCFPDSVIPSIYILFLVNSIF